MAYVNFLLDHSIMNNKIIEQFQLLIKQLLIDIDFSTGKQQIINTFRLKSIKATLEIIKKFPNKITSSDQLKNFKNIGKGSLKRIDEIIKTGKLAEVNLPMHTHYLQMIEELENIYGIGRKKAYELIKNHNVTSIDDLKKKYANGTIELPENIIKGLKYVGKIKENIPRSEIDQVQTVLTNTLSNIDPELFGIICGSYRRLCPTSGDVDLIVVHPKIYTMDDSNNSKINYLQRIIQSLKKQKFIIDSLTADDVPTKYMGIFRWNGGDLRRIDIRFIPYESYYSAILYFTGSKNFNTKMRRLAISMGYTLNEYGLFDENMKMFKVNSEQEIFDILGMEYLTPDKRL